MRKIICFLEDFVKKKGLGCLNLKIILDIIGGGVIEAEGFCYTIHKQFLKLNKTPQ